jgi:hypothetical protein
VSGFLTLPALRCSAVSVFPPLTVRLAVAPGVTGTCWYSSQRAVHALVGVVTSMVIVEVVVAALVPVVCNVYGWSGGSTNAVSSADSNIEAVGISLTKVAPA